MLSRIRKHIQNNRYRKTVMFMMSLALTASFLLAAASPAIWAVSAATKPAPSLVEATLDDMTYRIMLDPGHGGNDTGADGINSSEKRINLLIAQFLKEELEQYDHVRVFMTRNKDEYVGLHERSKMAQKYKADLMVSLHNDSWDSSTPYDNGCSVLVAKKGSFRPEMANQEVYLARSILSELEAVGLVNRGLMRKRSTRVPNYKDGSQGDYHAVVRDGMRTGIPSILIEHAFCDSTHDYNHFLKTEKQLRKLAVADARGIARYLQLKDKRNGQILPSITVKGKKQECPIDQGAYYSMARKRYSIKIYEDSLGQGNQRHKSNWNSTGSAPAASSEEKKDDEKSAAAASKPVPAPMDADQVLRMNQEAQKKLPYVIWAIIGGFALAILLRELEFGFRIEFKVKKRNDRYDQWREWELDYHYRERVIAGIARDRIQDLDDQTQDLDRTQHLEKEAS